MNTKEYKNDIQNRIIESKKKEEKDNAKSSYKRIPVVHASFIKDKIKNGDISLYLSKQNYDNHFFGTKDYQRKMESRKLKGLAPQGALIISQEEAQMIINDYSGTGIFKTQKNGEILLTEKISCDNIIGKHYDKGEWYYTNKAQIHYSKKGSHLVPIKGSDYD